MTRQRTTLPKAEEFPRHETDSLTGRARRGALWTAASTILLRLGNILVMAVVARLISPEDLGLYALAIAVYGFVASLSSWGVASAIGRSDLDADKLGPTVTTFALSTTCVVATLMMLLAGPVASAFEAPAAAGPIRILAVALAVQGFVDVPGAQIQRTFRQNVLFRANVVAFVLSNTTLLALATVINGAEAFAWSRVVGNLVVGVIIVLVLEKRYLPGWNARFVGPLLRFGVPVALGTLLSRFVLNVDFIIVGREMSTTDLGFYMLAFTICSWPTAALGAVMDQVALPAFSGARRDGRDLRVTVYRAVRLVAFVACPIGAFTVAFAHPLIETVYGAKWLTAAPVLQVLALYGVLYVLGTLFDEMMIASDKTVTMFVVQATALVALVPTLIIGIRLGGLVGVGIGHIVVMLGVTMPAYLVAMNATTGAGLVVVVRALLRPVLAAGAAAGVALLVTSFVDHPLAKLALGGLTGLMAYVAVAGPQLLELFPDAIAHKRGVVTATQWLSVAANRLRLSRTR